jgi:hypothetical protein
VGLAIRHDDGCPTRAELLRQVGEDEEWEKRQRCIKDWLREGMLIDGYKIELTYRDGEEIRCIRKLLPRISSDPEKIETFKGMVEEIKTRPKSV